MRIAPLFSTVLFTAATTLATAAHGDVLALYDFEGDDTHASSVTHDHITLSPVRTRQGEAKTLHYPDDSKAPYIEDNFLYISGLTNNPSTTNAIVFDLTIEDEWAVNLETWNLGQIVEVDTTYRMIVEQVNGDETLIIDDEWGVAVRSGSIARWLNLDILGHPDPLLLQGGNTYRFSVVITTTTSGLMADNVSLHGSVLEAPLAPEPTTLMVLLTSIGCASLRRTSSRAITEFRARSSAPPFA